MGNGRGRLAMLIGIGRRAMAVALLNVLCTVTVAQQEYPSQPIRIIVPFPPGGSNDIIARALAFRLTDPLGKPVVVENKAGAGGVIGSEFVARATPDGHTLLFSSSTFSVTAAVRKLPYDPIGDFTAVASIGRGPMMIVVHPSVPAHSINELVALVRAKPGQFNYGTPGPGSINHLGMELFAYATKLSVTHVPYKGIAPAVNDTVSGQLQISMASLPSAYQFVRAGKLRALAVTGDKRIPSASDIPTLAESGITGSKVELRWGVLAPAKTPRAVVQRLNSEIVKAIGGKEIREMLEREGAEITPIRPDEFQLDIVREIEMWRAFAERAGLKIE